MESIIEIECQRVFCLFVCDVLYNEYKQVLNSVCVDRLCGLVVRVPGYTTEMCYVSCEVRTEFMYVM
jgi:hypothetical protein